MTRAQALQNPFPEGEPEHFLELKRQALDLPKAEWRAFCTWVVEEQARQVEEQQILAEIHESVVVSK